MDGKSCKEMIPTSQFWDTGYTNPQGVYIWKCVSDFSGWALRRGDHKSPLPHRYHTLKSYGSGEGRFTGVEGVLSFYNRVLVADPRGLNNDFDNTLYNECIDKINGKVRGDLDLSVDAFQAKQTAKQFKAGDMVIDFFGDISSWDSRHRGSNTVARALAKAIPIAKLAGALRLSWVYGWKPLINDFYGVLDEGLRTYINKYQTYNAVRSSRYQYSVAGAVDWTGYNLAPFQTNRSETCRVSVTLDTDSMPELASWTSLNPVSIAWELLPFSFVIDWFVDVGASLRSLETALLYNSAFKSGFVSRIVVNKGISTGGSVIVPNGTYSASGHWTFTDVSFDRTVLTSFPVRRLPSVDVGLSSPRLFNAIGLLTQFLGKR